MKVNISKKVVNVLGVLFLGLLGVLLVFDSFRSGIYSSSMGINVAVIGDDSVSLMLLRPDEGLISWIRLPKNLKIKIYNSAATYPLLSLWSYGSSEKKPFEVFEQSLGLTLGVAVPRAIKVSGDASIESVLGSLHKIRLLSDLSLRDKWLIRQFVYDSVDSNNVIEEIVPTSMFDEIVEPDGKRFLVVNSVASLWTNSKFILEPILSENTDVSINNLSGLSGYGFGVSRQIESAGMRVIDVKADKTDDVDGSGCLFSIPENVTVSERFFVEHLGCRKIDSKEGKRNGIYVWLK